MYELMQRAAYLLAQAQHVVALTGAGFSTPSGIPDFRSHTTGLWENFDPLEIASQQAFRRRPGDFFNWIRPLARQMFAAQPNAAHYALAHLEQTGRVEQIITQNIDGLHQRAGAQHIIELHGDIFTGTCVSCYLVYHSLDFEADFIDAGRIPQCPSCGGIIKPNVILFGEALPVRALQAAKRAAAHCDLMLIAGSSLEVAPAADLPMLARAHQARLIMINQGTTHLDDHCDVLIHADVAVALPEITALCLANDSSDPLIPS